MLKGKARFFLIALAVLLVVVSLVACTPASTTPAETSAETSMKASPVTEAAETEKSLPDAPVIGITTGMVGPAWRNQVADDLEMVGEEYKAAGIIKDYRMVHNSQKGDVTEQANIIRDFINAGDVDIILVNPNSAEALNDVMHEAQDEGIVVFVYGSDITATDIPNISLDQIPWMTKNVEYICEALGGKGDLIEIYGLEGHPNNKLFMQATRDVIAKYPDINLVASACGSWSQETSKTETTKLIASGINIDGVVAQVGNGYGALSAFIDAGQIPKVAFGDPGKAFFNLWKQLRDQGADFKAVTVGHPPGVGATAMKLAVRLYNGKQFKEGVLNEKGKLLYMPSIYYTDENFDEGWELLKDKPDDYFLDEIFTEEQVDHLFQ